jgi:hypothetical protein
MGKVALLLDVSIGYIHKKIKEYNINSRSWNSSFTFKGKTHSEETKQLISGIHKGKKISNATKNKISNNHKGKLTNPSQYGGHKKRHMKGYVLVYAPNHPYGKNGYVFEHILAYEKANNCIVDREKFVVHHINGIKTDNNPKNVMLMTKSEHMSYHQKLRHQNKRIKENNLCKSLYVSEI